MAATPQDALGDRALDARVAGTRRKASSSLGGEV
jgi:hypothetical protein